MRPRTSVGRGGLLCVVCRRGREFCGLLRGTDLGGLLCATALGEAVFAAGSSDSGVLGRLLETQRAVSLVVFVKFVKCAGLSLLSRRRPNLSSLKRSILLRSVVEDEPVSGIVYVVPNPNQARSKYSQILVPFGENTKMVSGLQLEKLWSTPEELSLPFILHVIVSLVRRSVF